MRAPKYPLGSGVQVRNDNTPHTLTRLTLREREKQHSWHPTNNNCPNSSGYNYVQGALTLPLSPFSPSVRSGCRSVDSITIRIKGESLIGSTRRLTLENCLTFVTVLHAFCLHSISRTLNTISDCSPSSYLRV